MDGLFYVSVVVFAFLSVLIIVHGIVLFWNKFIVSKLHRRNQNDEHEELFNRDFVRR